MSNLGFPLVYQSFVLFFLIGIYPIPLYCNCLCKLMIFLFFIFFWDLKEELQRTNLELDSYKEKIKENQEKIKLNKQLPYLVGNIVEVIL